MCFAVCVEGSKSFTYEVTGKLLKLLGSGILLHDQMMKHDYICCVTKLQCAPLTAVRVLLIKCAIVAAVVMLYAFDRSKRIV